MDRSLGTLIVAVVIILVIRGDRLGMEPTQTSPSRMS
jgi:hypothetical protein